MSKQCKFFLKDNQLEKNCPSTKIHLENSVSELKKRIHELEEENKDYQKEITVMKEKLKKDKKLFTCLQLERFKNKIYRHIIEKNTNICVDDVLVEDDDGVHIYNIKGGSIPIFVHENIKSEEVLTVVQKLPFIKNRVPKPTL